MNPIDIIYNQMKDNAALSSHPIFMQDKEQCKKLGHAWKCLRCGEARDGVNPNDFWKDTLWAKPDELRHRIGMLRQWLNERPANSPLLTSEQLEHWLLNQSDKCLKEQ